MGAAAKPNIALIGFMGTGKSTVGRIIAESVTPEAIEARSTAAAAADARLVRTKAAAAASSGEPPSSGPRHASRGPQSGQAMVWAWKRRASMRAEAARCISW